MVDRAFEYLLYPIDDLSNDGRDKILPAIIESYATPTPQILLSLAAAISPAQRVP